jgi:hypothetical protein
MDPAELSATLLRDGYAVVPGVLPPEGVAALAAELGPLSDATPSGRNPFEENQYLAVPSELARTLAPELQRLLGYGVYGDYLGYVDGRHPSRLLKG